MTDREKELTDALALVIQKGERLAESINQWEWTRTAYVADHDAPVGGEVWSRNVAAMKEATAAMRHDRIILHASIREAKDTLYAETPKTRAA